MHTDLRTTPAEFAVCYKVAAASAGANKNKSPYACDQGTFDDRNPSSIALVDTGLKGQKKPPSTSSTPTSPGGGLPEVVEKENSAPPPAGVDGEL